MRVQRRPGLFAARHGQGRPRRELRPRDVEEARAGRRDFGAGEPAEPVERRHAILLADPPLGGGGLEFRLS